VTEQILSPEQVATELQLGKSTVYRALAAGHLPGTKVCGQWRTLLSQLHEYVRDGRVPAARGDGDPMPRPRAPRRGRFRSKVTDLESRRAHG